MAATGFALHGTGRALGAVLCTAAIAALVSDAWAAGREDLYAATVIVTGRDNLAERQRGIAEALPLALTRVTADPQVAISARERGMTADAASIVTSLDYVDRKAGIQISDEQGTRERSFELTVHFDPGAVDAIIRKAGGQTWAGPRPTVAVQLEVEAGDASFAVTRMSEAGYGQRLAILDEAAALGLPVLLKGDDRAAMAPFALGGRMTMTPRGLWVTAWTLEGEGLREDFSFQPASFDVAIGAALRRTARLLAGRRER